ncbi:probable oligoribonuclease [Paramacrobiotus metropolitanus]|uniref:probable oligoribonuclease n=1 Tax=Paramacrobiotus metropolitanus TaxID=2943436 RepID=UPI0024459B7E|nr:probable oligoribonuclease [Paramacrobiotus metropolitanus]
MVGQIGRLGVHHLYSLAKSCKSNLLQNVARFRKGGVARNTMARSLSTSTRLRSGESDRHEFDDNKNLRIVWVDLEMSGLDPDAHTILEMACVVTDNDLNIVAEAPEIIIHHPLSVREKASEWCENEFAKYFELSFSGKLGIMGRSRKSETSLHDAEQIMSDFLKQNVTPKKSPLAGNSIYMDRIFLRKHMPVFEDYLHYRIIDVSTVKELSKRWYPENHYKQPKKVLAHRALSDVKESIEEMRWYRANVFRPQ